MNNVACNYGSVNESELTADLKNYVSETIATKDVIRKSKHKIEKVEYTKLPNNHLLKYEQRLTPCICLRRRCPVALYCLLAVVSLFC
ncbi:hypothetical protein PHET_00910 [Paragonimus heterotremus]|uniref:Uncharacterized protein n=1 Tax=Paragonimus heterotremus TaxID=100268 RepID=A0A8J4TSA8_9TREM|nr:hypothetical protein PHET_00910 [Paragonimus heterotremus]